MATCNLMPWIKSKFFDDNNNPLTGGKVYTYLANSQVPAVTYTDYTCSTANANPIILDSRGECDIWMDTELVYKVVVKDSLDVEVWSVDGVKTSLNGGGGGGIEFVTSENTESVEINGLGTNINPLSASVRVSDLSLNALSITSYGITSMSSGLYVPDLNPRLTSVEGAVVSLDSRVTTNEGNIATNTSNIATNTANIATNRSDLDYLLNEHPIWDNQATTGVNWGLSMSLTGGLGIQVAIGEGYSVDRTDPTDPEDSKVQVTTPINYTIVNSSAVAVFIFLDNLGNVLEFTTQDPKRKYEGLISLGAITLSGGVAVEAVNVPNLAFSPHAHLLDLNSTLGIIRNGATLSKVNNTLNIAQASGYLLIMGGNFSVDSMDPNRRQVSQVSPKPFTPSTPLDLTTAQTTTINVTQWWNPSTQLLETLGNNKWTIIRFYQGANLELFAFYGQAEYSTKDEAIKSVSEGTYPFQNHPILANRQNAIYLGDLIIQKSMTNLNNAGIINADILGLNASGGASVNPVWGQITGTLSNQTDLQSELSTLQSGINTNASDITALDSRVSTNETDISNNQTAITNLQNTKQDNLPNGVSVLNYLGWSGTSWIARNIDYSEIQNPPTIPTNYVTTNSTQSGLSGDKTWTGKHIFSGGSTEFNGFGGDGLNIKLPTSGGRIGNNAVNVDVEMTFADDQLKIDIDGANVFDLNSSFSFLQSKNTASSIGVESTKISFYQNAGLYNFLNVPTGTPSFYYGQNASGDLVKFSAPTPTTPTLQQVTTQGSTTNVVSSFTSRLLVGGATDDLSTPLQVQGATKQTVGGNTLSTLVNSGEINYTNDLFLQYRTGKGINIGGNTGSGLPSFLNIFGKLKVTDVPTGTQQYLLAVDSSGNVIQGSASGGSSVTWQFGRWFNSALYNDVAFPPSMNWGDDGTGNPLIALKVAEAKTLKIVTFEAVQNSTTSFDLQIVKNGVGTTIGSVTSASQSFTGLSISISAGDKIYFKATNVSGGATLKGVCIVAKAE